MPPLPIDLFNLSEPELIELNHKIIARLRFIRDSKAHHQMRDLRPGDRVSFSPEPGKKVVGTILRLNRKSVSLVGSDGVHWRVAPAFVSLVETQDVEAEVSRPAETAAGMPGLRTLPLFQSPPSAEVPRNAPCPCGSGKKYKRCCLVKSAGLQ